MFKLLAVNGKDMNKRAGEIYFNLTKFKSVRGGAVSPTLYVLCICVYVCMYNLKKEIRVACCLRLAGCLFSLFFDHKNWGSKFLRNVGELLPNY
jgi:hypothetical protein